MEQIRGMFKWAEGSKKLERPTNIYIVCLYPKIFHRMDRMKSPYIRWVNYTINVKPGLPLYKSYRKYGGKHNWRVWSYIRKIHE